MLLPEPQRFLLPAPVLALEPLLLALLLLPAWLLLLPLALLLLELLPS